MITCGWCNTHYETWRSRCDSCGGPMPPQPGHELGPEPPPVPRPLPKGFAFRQKWSGNVLSMIGGVFFVIGAILSFAFLFLGGWLALFPMLFAWGGYAMLRSGRRSAAATLNAFTRGEAVKGKVVSVTMDYSQSMNGQHPWKLVYHFPVAGEWKEGIAVSWDSTVTMRAAGQPLWVLYLPEDPDQNTLYPPLK